MRPLVAHCHLGLGMLYLTMGRLVLRTANYLARWARGSVAFQAPRQRVELVRDVCCRVLEPARAELSAAIALYRSMGMTFWLPQAEAALARVE
jgi:hypothetical protein